MDTKPDGFPAVAKALGYGGTIPFVVLAVCSVAGIELSAVGIDDIKGKLPGYGAVIISFIGAVHWGIAMQSAPAKQNTLFVYSVIPALVAWMWLFFNVRIALFGMAITIVAMLFIDRFLLAGIAPQGYLKMRVHLTVIVALCLLLAAIF